MTKHIIEDRQELYEYLELVKINCRINKIDSKHFINMIEGYIIEARTTAMSTRNPSDSEIDHLIPHWKSWFATVGALALTHIDEFVDREFVELMIRKNNHYGDGPLVAWGILGFVVRLDSKVCRLVNLMRKKEECIEEPIRDTLIDILGYSILGYMFIEKFGG